MFNQKSYSFHTYPGIYQFQIPFYKASLVPDESGIVPVLYCDVEMHVGAKNDRENLIATILIATKSEFQSPTNFIERVVSTIYNNYLPIAVQGSNCEEFVRWVKREPYPNERFSELIVNQDKKGKVLRVHFGAELDNDDYIIQNHKLPNY